MQTRLIRIFGIVQGVGFRPFIHRLATRFGLYGTVANKGSFVEVFVQGDCTAKDAFQAAIAPEAPERSLIMKVTSEEIDQAPFEEFTIIESEREDGAIFVSPDIAICPNCQRELFDPNDRRYLHPFINCTACGPRLSILDTMPYDRERTSMRSFPLCEACAEEYTNPATRRFDAQPVCCHDCGPTLYTYEPMHPDKRLAEGNEAIPAARKALMEGKILAIKGIGGFHLACNAYDQKAIETLRTRKVRPDKPFAVMVKDIKALKRFCTVTPRAEELLSGWQKPIVILERTPNAQVSNTPALALAPDNPTLGVMLPYTPLHLLLFTYPDDLPMTDCLVMTSGNISGAPICHTDRLVAKELSAIADLVLAHNREILVRCDDSVVEGRAEPFVIRRSRGYAPLPTMVSRPWKGSVVGIGSDLKNTLCLGRDDLFYASPHIGDLGDVRTVEALTETFKRLSELLEITPEAVGCDTHPAYASVDVAEELGLPLFPVQHHHAHILSCLAENDVWEPVIGVALDGTGDGQDGTIWGGEILFVEGTSKRRLLSLTPFPHTGGDTASREGWRIALSMLTEALGEEEACAGARTVGLCTDKEAALQASITTKRLNTVFSTSTGRLFDAVSALLGLRKYSSYEGHAAQRLQFAAEKALATGTREKPSKAFALQARQNDLGADIWLPSTDLFLSLFRRAKEAASKGKLSEEYNTLALLFHEELVHILVAGVCKAHELTGCKTVALSGGVMQNALFASMLAKELEQAGFCVLRHRVIPANDGGLALGQAVYAMAKIQA